MAEQQEKKSDIITRTIRANKADLERLAELGKSDFNNQPEALEALINLYDIQQAKSAIPTRQADISDFDSHLQAIQRAYLHSLDLAENAESRARDATRAQLESKDKLIEDLQIRAEVAEAAKKAAQDAGIKACDEATQLEASLKAAEARIAELAANITDKQRIIESLSAQVADNAKKAQENEAAAARTADAEQRAAKAETEIARLQAAHEAALQVSAANAEAAKAQAVAEAEREAHRKTTELMEQITALTTRAVTAEAKAAALEAETQATNKTQNAKNAKKPTSKKE